jgi:hypothetical protein
MGLKTLEWHEGKRGAWTARVHIATDSYGSFKYRRYADVNAYDWVGYVTRIKQRGKVPVVFSPAHYGVEPSWHDSIEAAKLHVEAIFALDDY